MLVTSENVLASRHDFSNFMWMVGDHEFNTAITTLPLGINDLVWGLTGVFIRASHTWLLQYEEEGKVVTLKKKGTLPLPNPDCSRWMQMKLSKTGTWASVYSVYETVTRIRGDCRRKTGSATEQEDQLQKLLKYYEESSRLQKDCLLTETLSIQLISEPGPYSGDVRFLGEIYLSFGRRAVWWA